MHFLFQRRFKLSTVKPSNITHLLVKNTLSSIQDFRVTLPKAVARNMFIPVIQEIVDSCFLPLVLQELLRGRFFFVCVQISELSSATDVRDRSLPCQLCCVRLLTMPHLISHVLGG